MNYYSEPGSHMRHKVKIVVNLLNNATKKQNMLQMLINLIQLLKKIIALRAEFDKPDNKFDSVPTSLNNLKTKLDDLDVDQLKTIPVELKILSDVVKNEVVKNTKYDTLKTKVNKLDRKFFMKLI